MKHIPVESSNIESVAWEDGLLEVKFKSGAVYQYANVPEWMYQDLLNPNISVGQYFNEAVKKGGYKYKRVSNES